VTKDEARARARERLRSLSAAEREAAAASIARRVWELPAIAAARTLLLYAPLPGEVPTDAIAGEAARRGIALTYPRCLPESRSLALHRVTHPGELLDGGSYGIREPDPSCPLLRVPEIDAVIVPGLAWDRTGTRLGRGAGYYDRLFADPGWRGLRCGIFFSVQEIAHLPRDPWDASLHAVVTELETVLP
jgi:5-formyltetrahydrofolate cyclo-ligase